MELNENQKFIFGLVLFFIFVLMIIGFIVFIIYGCYKIIQLFVSFHNNIRNRRCYESNIVESIPLDSIHRNENGNLFIILTLAHINQFNYFKKFNALQYLILIK